MSSASIKWATEHLDGFNALLARQLSSVERDSSVWKKCFEIVDEHALMLTEIGVDFHDIIGKGLLDSDLDRTQDRDLKASIGSRGSLIKTDIEPGSKIERRKAGFNPNAGLGLTDTTKF
jgi:hypothetical protein